MIIIISIFAAIAVFLFSKYFLSNLKSIEREGQVHNAASNKKGNTFMPAILRYASYLGGHLSKIKNPRLRAFVENNAKDFIILGGAFEKIGAYQFLALQIFAAMGGVLICVIFISTSIFCILIIAILFFVLPYLYVKESVNKKKALICKQLPDFADLLSVMLESGSDFFGATDKICSILKGPLSDEFSIAALKIAFGYDKTLALNEMAQKCKVEQLRSFVRTVIMSLEAGVGMADTLERLAYQMRDEKASIAEKKAQEAPVKILIPLVLFIFPTIFIVIFGPIAISFFNNGGL
ncbi:MAG: type II secretion system F family protein [Elusimicrobiota bacterium]|jgi:tight adherence protein C|nr:type II secretion system F family protein [Elusimicrobiota bacterium]